VAEMGRVLWLGVGAAVAGLGATFLLPTGSPVVGAARRTAEGVEGLIG